MLTKKGGTGLSASAESIQKRPSIRRNNSRHVHRTSSKRNKENGTSKKHSPSSSFKKSHQDKVEGKFGKYGIHETKQKKVFQEEPEPLKEGSVNTNAGRIHKDSGGGSESLMNIYGSQTLEDTFGNLGNVQDLRLLKMTSLDSPHSNSGNSPNKFQKINSLGSSSFIGDTVSSPQLCKQMKVDDVKEEEEVSDMDVISHHVTLTYKPRI